MNHRPAAGVCFQSLSKPFSAAPLPRTRTTGAVRRRTRSASASKARDCTGTSSSKIMTRSPHSEGREEEKDARRDLTWDTRLVRRWL
jgi:hypothetical protein